MLGGRPRPPAPNLPRPAWKRLWCRLYDCGNSPAPARRKTSPDLLPRARRLVRLELCRNSGHQVSVQIPPPQRELSAGGYCDTGFGIWCCSGAWSLELRYTLRCGKPRNGRNVSNRCYFLAPAVSPSRGTNSNVTLPISSITRYAGNGRPALEMNSRNRSVRLSASNLAACARSIGCCKISLLILNEHGRLSACDFSHR